MCPNGITCVRNRMLSNQIVVGWSFCLKNATFKYFCEHKRFKNNKIGFKLRVQYIISSIRFMSKLLPRSAGYYNLVFINDVLKQKFHHLKTYLLYIVNWITRCSFGQINWVLILYKATIYSLKQYNKIKMVKDWSVI